MHLDEVKRLLKDTLEIQKEGARIIDGLIEELQKDVPDRERLKIKTMVRRQRIYVERQLDQCWSNIAECYKILQDGKKLPDEDDDSGDYSGDNSSGPLQVIEIE